jgi:hypothetical protein
MQSTTARVRGQACATPLAVNIANRSQQRILYLSAEQRLNYLVRIDTDGKIRWDRNGQYVDTHPGRWRDAGEGKGIVPIDEDNTPLAPPESGRTRSDSSSSSSSEEEVQAARHYQGISKQNLNIFQRIWKEKFTSNGLMERLLRKTVQKNTWVYVSVSDLKETLCRVLTIDAIQG